MIDPAILRSIPKVELHCHLEGSIPPATLIDLARRRGISLPTEDPTAIYRFDDLGEFLAVYEVACDAMVDQGDFARVAYEALCDASVSANVVHREMFWNPTLHRAPYAEQLAGILEGARAAEREHGIVTRLIPSIYRNQPVGIASAMVADVVAHRVDEVIGIGMDGDEMTDPPGGFRDVYAEVAAAGLHRTAHVAHDGPADFIRTCLDELGCERVDHGYHVVDDPALLRELADRRVPFLCASGTPPICGWPTEIEASPIRTMIEAGLTVVLNSDDPAMFGADLADEYVRLVGAWQLDADRVRRLVFDAVDAAWLDDVERGDLRARVAGPLDELLPAGPDLG